MPNPITARRLRGATVALVVTAVGFAAAAPAHADPANAFEATLSATRTSVTVDLSATQYQDVPTGLRIAADLDSTEYDITDLSSGFNGVYTLTGLRPDTTYTIWILEYSDNGQSNDRQTITTPKDVNSAPVVSPLQFLGSDGIHASVTAQADYDMWDIHDGGTLASLKYNVYAYVNGVRYKKVLTAVNAGVKYTIAGLPLGKQITFTETDVNSIGESPESARSGAITLAPVAPGLFTGTTYTDKSSTEIVWKGAAAGTGTITKYVVRLTQASKTVFSRTYSSKTRDITITKLKRHTRYIATVTAYNSYGKHTTITGALTTK